MSLARWGSMSPLLVSPLAGPLLSLYIYTLYLSTLSLVLACEQATRRHLPVHPAREASGSPGVAHVVLASPTGKVNRRGGGGART
jgi:hypothetical protein